MAEKKNETAPVKRGRGRPKGTGGNKRPDRSEAMSIHVKPGDNAKFLANKLRIVKLPAIDTADGVAVAHRIDEYFNICIEDDVRPTVSGCALALGIDRTTFNNWCNGTYRSESHLNSVKKAHEMLDSMMEDYMMNGKINPVAGIFLMKNNHGYKDQQDIQVSSDSGAPTATPEQLSEKYETIVDAEFEEVKK